MNRSHFHARASEALDADKLISTIIKAYDESCERFYGSLHSGVLPIRPRVEGQSFEPMCLFCSLRFSLADVPWRKCRDAQEEWLSVLGKLINRGEMMGNGIR